jgi:hypothetical protein
MTRVLPPQPRGACRPRKEVDIGVERADDCRERQPERRADHRLAPDDGHGLGGDPGRGAEHADTGHEIGDLLELAAAELKVLQLAAMQPPHHRVGENLDRHPQHEADGFGLERKRATQQAYGNGE